MFKLVVLSSVLAMAAAAPSALGLGWGLGGLGWGGHLAGLGAPLVGHVAPVAVAGPAVALSAPLHGAAYNYRGPLSLAPGQPANILAADGRPLDTLSVNLDRAAHYTARAVDGHGAHILGKRSAPLLAPAAAWSHTARVDIPARLVAPAGLGWHGGVTPWGVGPVGPAAALGHAGVWGLHG